MKRILIIGSTSVVGRACGELLASEGEVFYAGRENADFHLDVASPGASLPEGLKFDVVILAAADFGGNTEDDIYRAEQVNALGVLTVCRIAHHAGAGQLLLVSTISACYQPQDAYFNIYALSKRHGEELAQLYCQKFGLPLTILRPTQLYDAASQCRRHQPFFYAVLDKVQKGEDIEFYGSNDAVRNYLFLDDFVEVVARAVRGCVLGVFNCPAPRSSHLSDIVFIAGQVFGTCPQIRFLQDMPDIANLPVVGDESSLYAIIEYIPATSLDDGILKIRQARENN